MRNCLFRKGLVLALILLFIFIGIFPSSGLIPNRESYKSIIKTKNLFDFKLKNLQDTKGEDIPGVYSFYPCFYINITGEGSIDIKEAGPISFLVWELSSGTVKINFYINKYEKNDKITTSGTFFLFDGSMSKNPVKIIGEAFWGSYFEKSEIIEIITDKERYRKGETITIKSTNINEDTIIIEKPCFTIYKTTYSGEYNEIFSKSFDDTIMLDPGKNFEWSWNQKDKNGKQISFGEYIVSGQFPIQGINRTHNCFKGFFIRLFGGDKPRTTENNRQIQNNKHYLNQLYLHLLERFIKVFPTLRYLYTLKN